MKKKLIILFGLLISCNNIKDSNENKKESQKTNISQESSNDTKNSKEERKKDSLKQLVINWDTVPIQKLPISSKAIEEGVIKVEKYCCYPKCDKNYKANQLDMLFSNHTESTELSKYEGNGHPSSKQGYFGLRLPDINQNKLLIYSYFDLAASDYKSCTMELQIFSPENKLIDKKIIHDAVNYECGWKRKFEIFDNQLKLIDSVYCYDLESRELINSKENVFKYEILSSGKIKIKK